jgi:hypothetical protein
VVFDALDAAVARQADVVLIDTAGRLHTKSNLMDELAKIRRVIDRRLPGAEPETLLVLDATTGQNGLAQAIAFHNAVNLTGIVLTKLDSTSRGGIVFAIEQQLGVPVRFAGVGERPEDLVEFDPAAFVDACSRRRHDAALGARVAVIALRSAATRARPVGCTDAPGRRPRRATTYDPTTVWCGPRLRSARPRLLDARGGPVQCAPDRQPG